MDDRIEDLKPKGLANVEELLQEAGLDISKWLQARIDEGSRQGMATWAARVDGSHWAYEFESTRVLCLWHRHMCKDDQGIYQRINPAQRSVGVSDALKRKAVAQFEIACSAFQNRCPVRVIIADRDSDDGGSAKARALDKVLWTVTEVIEKKEVVVRRGIHLPKGPAEADTELLCFTEGQIRESFRAHRYRETKLRELKIKEFRDAHDNRLFCEVPGCGFDFEATYGELGNGFAEVHHLDPMRAMPHEGAIVTTEDLAVVCANCHRMIHRNGACRSLHELLTDRTKRCSTKS